MIAPSSPCGTSSRRARRSSSVEMPRRPRRAGPSGRRPHGGAPRSGPAACRPPSRRSPRTGRTRRPRAGRGSHRSPASSVHPGSRGSSAQSSPTAIARRTADHPGGPLGLLERGGGEVHGAARRSRGRPRARRRRGCRRRARRRPPRPRRSRGRSPAVCRRDRTPRRGRRGGSTRRPAPATCGGGDGVAVRGLAAGLAWVRRTAWPSTTSTAGSRTRGGVAVRSVMVLSVWSRCGL